MRLTAGNPMVPVLRVTLVFEAVVFALAVPGMAMGAELSWWLALTFGGAALLIAVAAVSRLPSADGFVLGWLAQGAALGLGFATPWMFAAGGLFVALWLTCLLLGHRLPPDAPGAAAS